MSSVDPVRRLPNFTDHTATDIAGSERTVEVLSRPLNLRGYQRVETPMLEQAELFIRKSGGELSSRLYGFVEPGGYRVGLRPEFTAPVLRYAIETAGKGDWPRRYRYSGPVFRYASPGDEDADKPRQFTQVGAELIGTSSPMSDGEILAAALEGLDEMGLSHPVATVGHVGVYWDVLKPFGLSDRARLFLVNSIGEFKTGGEAVDQVRIEADRLGLTGDTAERAHAPAVHPGASLEDVKAVIDATIGPTDTNAGVRTRSEIVERLARKQMMSSDPASFAKAFDLVANLATINGEIEEAMERLASTIDAAGGDVTRVEPLQKVLDSAIVQGVSPDSIQVDMGVARGIAYYTGTIFDLYSGDTKGESLGGGGRYDGLTRALGAATDLPALGFAYRLEAVVAAAGQGISDTDDSAPVVVAAADDSAIEAAVREAGDLRSTGTAVILDFESRSADERQSFALASGASELVLVASDGTSRREPVR